MSQRYFHDSTIFFAQFSVMNFHTSFQTHLTCNPSITHSPDSKVSKSKLKRLHVVKTSFKKSGLSD